MVSYAVVLVGSIYLTKGMDGGPLKMVVALAPIVPIIFGGYAFVALLRQLDELQRRIHFEAFGFSIAITGIATFSLATFSLALLERAGYPILNLFWVLPMLIAFWGIGGALARRRYR